MRSSKLRLTIFVALITIVPNAFASWSRSSESEEGTLALCERRLAFNYLTQRDAGLGESVFRRPFIGWIVHHMTAAGLEKTGLDPKISVRELKDLVLVAERSRDRRSVVIKLSRYRNGAFQTALEYGFFNPNLLGYEMIRIRPAHADLDYDELIREYPVASERNLRRVGYRSAPDQDGVRRYVAFVDSLGTGDRVSSIVEFGIDVPYDKATIYSSDIGEVTDDLRADSGRYVRIGVLGFARVD
jgi:hypothetical protein